MTARIQILRCRLASRSEGWHGDVEQAQVEETS